MKNIFKIGIILSTFTALIACDENLLEGQNVLTAKSYIKQEAAYAKPGAALTLENKQVNLEVSGAQYAIDVGIVSGYEGALMELSVSASDGLYITKGETNVTSTLSKGVNNHSYTIIASENGRYYLYLNATVTENDKKTPRALTLIVQVGEEQKASQKTNALEGGNIVMPAKEEIITQ